MRAWGLFAAVAVLGLAFGLPTTSAAAKPAMQRTTGLNKATFPMPASLRANVYFWEDVFGKYSYRESVLQSRQAPGRIIRILHFPENISRAQRNKKEKRAVAQAEKALKAIVAAGGRTAKLGHRARHIYQVFGGGNTTKFKHLEGSLRVQRGQRERTRKGLQTAGRYLPTMRSIFEHYELPVALTRLPIVESSFNVKAYSKAGAAGIWQFIPAAARVYMKLDVTQDDRRDPWTSTDAAARMLKDNYEALGSWPLAITAYNYGRTGIARGLKKTHTHTLAGLIEHYDHPRFGFASKNFYAEFLAASAIANHASAWFGKLAKQTPIRFDVVTTTSYVPYATLRRISGASTTAFAQLNPAFSAAVVNGRLYCPPGSSIRVPAGHKAHFQQLLAGLGPHQRFTRQRVWYVSYRVRHGDTLSTIAHRHHTSTHRLMRMNHLRSARYIRVGQRLKIPTGGGSAHLVSAVRHTPHVFTHRIRSGETLSSIARNYHVSVHALMRENGLHDAGHIRAGQKLKIRVRGAHLVAAANRSSTRPRATSHRIRSGETLSGIARHYHVSVHALMRANNLHSARHIRAGQRLRIPASRVSRPQVVLHRVRHGQTLSGIAHRHHVSIKRLRTANDLHDADYLRVGMMLKIPTLRQ